MGDCELDMPYTSAMHSRDWEIRAARHSSQATRSKGMHCQLRELDSFLQVIALSHYGRAQAVLQKDARLPELRVERTLIVVQRVSV
jgi:hypothetical protein